MRRNALQFSGLFLGLITFVIVSISATAGKAADEEQHRTAANLPPLLLLASQPAPAAANTELLHEFSTIAVSTAASPVSTDKKPRTILMEVTAYCPCRKCCGKGAHGVTASGLRVTANAGLFVAADSFLPFHTKLVIPGYANERPVPVLDRGGAIKGNRLDVFFPTHQEALEWGRRMIEVTIAQ
jgi:3D (Asp-Asp-Asp) domain-containing protein